MIPITSKNKKLLVFEILLSCFGFGLTLAFGFLVFSELFHIAGELISVNRLAYLALHLLFIGIIASLLYGGVIYQLTRLFCYVRMYSHRGETFETLAPVRTANAPALSVLIPSYKEEHDVVLRTMLSAALQSYPNKNIALLLDDPPNPKSEQDAQGLSAARELPKVIQELIAKPRSLVDAQYRNAKNAEAEGQSGVLIDSTIALLFELEEWFRGLATELHVDNHEAAFFTNKVLLERASYCKEQREAVAQHPVERAKQLSLSLLEYFQAVFSVELTTFERKQFENLSHEPNKAMNLNSYLGLLGKSFRVDEKNNHIFLNEDAQASDVVVPAADYVITLDADSILMPDYAAKLVHFLQSPENADIAVVQTPYNSFPGADVALERFASATTDIQYIIHQGFTAARATYWVGANALLRVPALKDIVVEDQERGYTIRRYIQDRTVIEDTESSIDLVNQDWQLHNYPERLAFSATPPDLGSLIIQRQRWANGGLIILPKLLRYLFRNFYKIRCWLEGFVRIHYLVSITLVNFGLLIVLVIPFTDSVKSHWLPLSALPYFLLYARDLKLSGYRYRDLFGVYALNLILIPINISGVLTSIGQMISKAKIPFRRTPKVEGRTVAGAWYLVAHYLLVLQWTFSAGVDFYYGRNFHAGFALMNVAFLFGGMLFLVGLQNSIEDIALAWRPFWRRFRRRRVFPIARKIGYPRRPLFSRG